MAQSTTQQSMDIYGNVTQVVNNNYTGLGGLPHVQLLLSQLQRLYGESGAR